MPAISFVTESNQAPSAADAAFEKASYETGDTASVRYTYSDPDGDEEGNTLFCFTFADGSQVVTDTPSVKLNQAGKVARFLR